MSDLVRRFEDAWHSEDASGWPRAFLGDQSLLSQMLLAAPQLGLKQVAATLHKLADNKNRLRMILESLKSPLDPAAAVRLLTGLSHLLHATHAIHHKNDPASSISSALQDFDVVVGYHSSMFTRSATNAQHDQPIDLVTQAFQRLDLESTDASYWMAFDLVERWYHADKRPRAVHTATTTVMGALATGIDGLLLRFTVELIPCEQGILYPDLPFLGLTDVTVKNGAKSFWDSMSHIWTVSQAGKHYRGRWRIEHPSDSDPMRTALSYPRSFGGRSAEAAALCAMLAATGDPYHEQGGKGDQPEPIELTVAISATVGDADQTKSPLDVPLGKVGAVPAKLRIAMQALDTAIFVSGETDVELTTLRHKEEAERRQGKAVKNNVSATAKSVAEALDQLLVTNRYLARYRQATREDWLCQWDGDTGRAAQDELPWTAEMAQRAREQRQRS